MHQRVKGLKASPSARVFLTAFATVLLTPVLVLAAVALSQYAASERNRYVEEARRAAHDIAADLDRELGQAQAAAQALATSRLIQNGSYEAFQEQASDFLRSWVPDAPNSYAVVLRGLDDQQLVNTRLPRGTPLPKIARDADRLVITTKRPQVQDLFPSTSANRPTVAVRVPVFKDGEVTHVLSLALEPRRIAELLQAQKLSADWNRSVVDRNGRIVAHWPEHDRFVGTLATEDLREQVGSEGTFIGTNLEGTPVLVAYARSELSGWLVTVSIPLSTLQGPFRNWQRIITALFIPGF